MRKGQQGMIYVVTMKTVNNVLLLSSGAAVVYLFLHDIAFRIQLMKVTNSEWKWGVNSNFFLQRKMEKYFRKIIVSRSRWIEGQLRWCNLFLKVNSIVTFVNYVTQRPIYAGNKKKTTGANVLLAIFTENVDCRHCNIYRKCREWPLQYF